MSKTSLSNEVFLNFARESLKELDPIDVCARTGAVFHRDQEEYELTILGYPARVKLEDCSLEWHWSVWPLIHIITLHYLIHADGSKPKGDLISLYDVAPTASTRVGHMIKANIPPLTTCFAGDMPAFRDAVYLLGGDMLKPDTAELLIYPHIPIQITIWPADDEFPADARILFDRTLKNQLPGESIVYVADIAVQSLLTAAQKTGVL